MGFLINTAYLLALLVLSPWLLYRSLTQGKYRRGLLRKWLGLAMRRNNDLPCAWFHGVSVGEVYLLRQLIARFRDRHPTWECVVSTTTDTGFAEACKHFPDLHVFYWPLDFTWAVHRALRQVNPSLIILAESELWPNFLAAARKRGVPVAVVNGRMSPRSLARYRRLGFLVRSVLDHLDLLAVQTEEYAAGFRALGADPQRVQVTGSVKYDGVQADRANPKTRELRRQLAVQPDSLVWVAGSTQRPEEELVLGIYRRLKDRYPKLRLFLVPRQKERFEEVANLLKHSGQAYVRRSQMAEPITDSSAVVLVDTMGELGALWGLADVAFVGGSLDGRRGGQNMIEPAAYGAAVVFGPHVWNFRETAARLVAARAAFQVADAVELETIMERLLADAAERERLGTAARQFVFQQQGATARTIHLLEKLIHDRPAGRDAA
ncbi:MAG: 3-deoxy-D-manno-octulosonic acid transferase [Planctomycetes bacterium]|nr:3-deoxy-D-manno-octulosonic acid transferase [Planctomycetota bacterium]